MSQPTETLIKELAPHRAEHSNGAICDTERTFPSLLARIAVSLRSSQPMLLHRQIDQLQRQTDYQMALLREISPLLSASTSGAEACPEHLLPALNADIRTSAQIVLQLGRIQLALLNRMQQFLKVSCNCAAGPTVTYPSPFASSRTIRLFPRIED